MTLFLSLYILIVTLLVYVVIDTFVRVSFVYGRHVFIKHRLHSRATWERAFDEEKIKMPRKETSKNVYNGEGRQEGGKWQMAAEEGKEVKWKRPTHQQSPLRTVEQW